VTAPGAARPLLALDAATSTGCVAAGTPGSLLGEVSLDMRASHSAGLLPAVDSVLGAAGIAPGDLGGVVVGSGPGSFTGLRIAAATAKGIVQALGVPLYAYPSLLAAAAQAWAAGSPVCALFDARGRDVYAACYRFDPLPEVVFAPAALTLDELVARLRGRGPVLFLGDGAARHAEELVRVTDGAVAPPHFHAPRAAALVWLACAAPALGRVDEPAGWEPEYLRASGAERIAARRSAGAGPA
jgi:tRNA threonylcarbamoyladenosine biosynthesis protein TsaB